MTAEEYLAVVSPKMDGTINLHNALINNTLDFFLEFSSIASHTGTATQANYCSANAFLDFFGRYRESLGLPVTALGIGMVLEVGHAAENPIVEEALSRNGVHSIYEHEFHQMLEVTLRPQPAKVEGLYDPYTRAHLLTGFEPGKLKDLWDRGFGGGTLWKSDPRLKMIFMAVNNEKGRTVTGTGAGGAKAGVFSRLGDKRGADAIAFFEGVVSEQLSRLLLIPMEQLDVSKSLVNFGVDSMIDAELRNWLYRDLRTEVSFVEIRAATTSIRSLAVRVVEAHGLDKDAMDVDKNMEEQTNGSGTVKRKAEEAVSDGPSTEKRRRAM